MLLNWGKFDPQEAMSNVWGYFWVSRLEGGRAVLLSSNRYGPGMLVNILQGIGQFLYNKELSDPNVLRSRNPVALKLCCTNFWYMTPCSWCTQASGYIKSSLETDDITQSPLKFSQAWSCRTSYMNVNSAVRPHPAS